MAAAFELVGGLIGLIIAGTAIVRGASVIGSKLGLPPLVIGLTIVAAGTSAPELAVVWRAADQGDAELALGSVVGSNIANVLLVLGIVATISAINVSRQAVQLDAPVMIGASLLTMLLGADGEIQQTDGFILVTCLATYITTTILVARRAAARGVVSTVATTDATAESMPVRVGADAAVDPPPTDEASTLRSRLESLADTFVGAVVVFAVGAVGVAISAQFVVSGAESLALSWGIPELVVGLTVLAIGTSAPEIATSVIAAIRGSADVALGNAIGSNVFNLLFVLGLVSATHSDLPVDSALQTLNLPVMFGAAVLALPYAITRLQIERIEGIMFLVIYSAYTLYLVLDGLEHRWSEEVGITSLVVITPLSLGVIVTAMLRHRRRPAT